jgi:hypothetical protein
VRSHSIVTMQVHWALSILYRDGFRTLLPVSIDIIGGRRIPRVVRGGKDKRLFTGWSFDGAHYDDMAAERAKALREKFEGAPMLCVSDKTLLIPWATTAEELGPNRTWTTQYAKDADTVATPTTWAKTWVLRYCFNPTARNVPPLFGVHADRYASGSMGPLSFQPEKTARFTDIQLLVNEIRRVGCSVTWANVPTEANQLIYLNDFSVNPPDLDVPDDLESYVDGKLSCSIAYTCIEPQASGSVLCADHTSRIEELVRSHRWTADCIIGSIVADLSFTLPDNAADLARVRAFVQRCEQVGLQNIWSTDSEGAVIKGYLAIPTEFGITNVADRSKAYEGFIKYPDVSSPADVVEDLFANRDGQNNDATRISGILRARSRYDRSAGTVRSHKAGLRKTGFKDKTTGMVLKWGSTRLDGDALARIEHGEDRLLVPQDDQYNIAIGIWDLAYIARKCLPGGTSGELSKVWKSLNPQRNEEKKWHTALVDANGAADVLERLLSDLKGQL